MATAAYPAYEKVGERSPMARFWTRAAPIISMTILIIFALIEIVPFVLTVANSFKCLPAVQLAPQSFIPTPPFGVACSSESGSPLAGTETTGSVTFNPTLEGYQEIVVANDLPRWFINTVGYAVAITLLRLLFDSMAGYALARLKFRGNRVLFYLMLGTMMIP